MTKYVLNSGGAHNYPDRKRKFHLEIIKGLSNTPKILICIFAQPRENWETKFEKYRASIASDMPDDVTPSFELAVPDNFMNQCKNADVLYFHGGDDHLLQYWMKRFDFSELFKDKIVATSSASSDMLVSHFWGSDWRQCADGFGIVPIKFIPHFKSSFGNDDPRGPVDWDKAYQDLAEYSDKTLPIFALEEGEFIVREL